MCLFKSLVNITIISAPTTLPSSELKPPKTPSKKALQLLQLQHLQQRNQACCKPSLPLSTCVVNFKEVWDSPQDPNVHERS